MQIYKGFNFSRSKLKLHIIISVILVSGLLVIPNGLLAQAMTVTGTITYNPHLGECFAQEPCFDAVNFTRDEDWIPPSAAVNIAVKGTDIVVKTDRDGNYQVNVPSPNASLMVMFIGFNRIEVPVEGRNVIDVKLTPTPLPLVDRVLGEIMSKIHAGRYPDIDEIALNSNVNRETARDILWIVIGNQPMMQNYPNEYIPDYRFEDYEYHNSILFKRDHQ